MAKRVNTSRVSETSWGDVDKGGLGRSLAAGYADGSVSAAVIREAYAFVPADAFGKDAEGKPTFAASKGWGPHHVLDGDELVVSRGGVQGAAGALAGARSQPSLSAAEQASARRHIRKHYRGLKMEAPDSLKETLRVVEVGRPLTEIAKGSFEYAADEVWRAFRSMYYDTMKTDGRMEYWPVETFPDALIVKEAAWDEPADEFYRVPYTRDADGKITFAPQEEWEPVELAYRARTENAPVSAAMGEGEGTSPLQRSRKRLEERAGPLAEVDGTNGNEGTRRIRINGLMTAGVVNGNGRRYPAHVLEAAVSAWRSHLHESAGQGRLKILTGEAEHPDDKGHRRAQFLETVVKWSDVQFDGTNVNVLGELILTQKGRDVATLMEAGVRPGGSVRGFYEAKAVKEAGGSVEEVTWCEITGADLVGDPSFANVADLMESRRAAGDGASKAEGDGEMNVEQLMELVKAHPELFKGIVAEEVKSMSEAQRAALEQQLREALGVPPEADVMKAVAEAAQAKREQDAARKQAAVDAAITEATKALPYGEAMNKAYIEALRAAKPETPEAVKALAEAKRKEYDGLAAAMQLRGMGRDVQVLGPVLERETGVPEFARASHEFSESMIRRGIASRRNLAQPRNVNEQVAARVIERFDQVYRLPLMREARMLQETELATDLNLPYSVSRAILAEVWPQLIATSLFDVDTTDQSPTRVYYEDYQDVSLKHVAITDEHWTTDHDDWVSLAHKMIQPGTVVVQTTGGSGTYVEGTDYIVDYLDGAIMALSTGTPLTDSTAYHVSYHYDSVREGENTAIQRAKMVLGYGTLDCKANRLATQITNEAMVFSRSQMGWDATARTLAGLVSELRREIDAVLMFNALNMALKVTSNSGGTWTASTDPLIDMVSYAGVAKVKLAKRFYEPQWLLLSATNSDTLGNWDGFTSAGMRPDSELGANGYVGRLKGLPVYASTEFSDSYGLIGNRQVVHYRIYQPMALKGPYPSYSSDKLVAADQWYAEQYDGWLSPVAGKASYFKIA